MNRSFKQVVWYLQSSVVAWPVSTVNVVKFMKVERPADKNLFFVLSQEWQHTRETEEGGGLVMTQQQSEKCNWCIVWPGCFLVWCFKHTMQQHWQQTEFDLTEPARRLPVEIGWSTATNYFGHVSALDIYLFYFSVSLLLVTGSVHWLLAFFCFPTC